MRRSTIGKTSSSLKQRQLSHFHSQLAQLEANLSDFDTLIKTTTVQAQYIKKLGIMHGSLLIASQKVFEDAITTQESYEENSEQNDDQELNTSFDSEK